MKRYTKFANTLPREHRNTPWAEFVPPVWGKRHGLDIAAVIATILALLAITIFTG